METNNKNTAPNCGENILLITHICDNDHLVNTTAGGSTAYLKACYVPPYKELDTLKKLLLRVKAVAGTVNAHTTVAIDLAEWALHSGDEYFRIIVKFLHDMSYKWNYIFTVEDLPKGDIEDMLLVLDCYLDYTIVENRTFIDNGAMKRYIMDRAAMDDDALAAVCSCFLDKRTPSMIRNFEILDMSLDKLTAFAGGKTITLALIGKCACDTQDRIISYIDRHSSLDKNKTGGIKA